MRRRINFFLIDVLQPLAGNHATRKCRSANFRSPGIETQSKREQNDDLLRSLTTKPRELPELSQSATRLTNYRREREYVLSDRDALPDYLPLRTADVALYAPGTVKIDIELNEPVMNHLKSAQFMRSILRKKPPRHTARARPVQVFPQASDAEREEFTARHL